ncbi:MAG: glycosyltransferase [Eubacterium sp.]
MRVLHMIPDIGISNGVMSVILNYFKAMPDDIKFDVLYFSEKDKTRQADIESLGGRVFKISPPSPKDLLNGKMNGFFDEHQNEWEALHIHCPHFAVFIAPYAKKHGIKKVFVHCHTTCFSLKGNQTRNRILSLYAKYFIKDRFACSNEAGRIWYGNRKFTVLNNAIDCSAYSFSNSKRNDVRERMNLSDSTVVGHIGRTDVVQKNHPFILKVFSEIVKISNNAQFLLMGAEKNEQLNQLCNSLNIEGNVHFLGIRNDIPDLLQACDVFLFPSISEGLPVSVIEAQAAGLPVLMSDTVSPEAAVTDLVKIKSLSDDITAWAKACVDMSTTTRCNTCEELTNAGWNIYKNAEALKGYYCR